MFNIGLSTCGKTFDENLFSQYRSAGIYKMEISMGMDDYEKLDFSEALRLSQKYGVELWSFHLPFMPFSVIDISKPELQEFSLDYLKKLIKKGADIGIKRFIIHPSGEPIKDRERKARMETAKNSLADLAQLAKNLGVIIAVEDLPRTCLGRNSDEMLELLKADDSLRVCLDTNHLLSESLTHFIKAVGEKIVTTHVSDYDFVDEKHWMPFEGKINWKEVRDSLKEADYDGAWLYELGFKAPDSMKRDRDITCEDFVRNAEKIFNL